MVFSSDASINLLLHSIQLYGMQKKKQKKYATSVHTKIESIETLKKGNWMNLRAFYAYFSFKLLHHIPMYAINRNQFLICLLLRCVSVCNYSCARRVPYLIGNFPIANACMQTICSDISTSLNRSPACFISMPIRISNHFVFTLINLHWWLSLPICLIRWKCCARMRNVKEKRKNRKQN